jgi:hypothetical protein
MAIRIEMDNLHRLGVLELLQQYFDFAQAVSPPDIGHALGVTALHYILDCM